MKEILDFSTSVMWRNLKLIHVWTNFSFLHMFHVQNFEIFPHDRFFLHGPGSSARDKMWQLNLPTKNYKSSNNKTEPTEIYKSPNKYLQIFQQ